MRALFETCSIGNLNLPNRFIRSATWEGMATDDGDVTPRLIETMVAMARGGVGLIITGHAFVRRDGKVSPWQLGIDHDNRIPGLRQMTDEVHRNNGHIIVQLAHGGIFTDERVTGQRPWAVSDFEGLSKKPRRELSTEDIHELVSSFLQASGRAREAGFDGIELHAAHGYLLSQFLSPYFNRRMDDYGGNIENRIRVHLEIIRSIHNESGDYPVLVKMNCRDFIENGLNLEESLHAAKFFAESGIGAIELSGGLLTSRKLSPTRLGMLSSEKEVYYREEAARFKKTIRIPLILTGGIRSCETAQDLVGSGTADFISMSRPFVRDPDLINQWKASQTGRSACKSDNYCFRPGMLGGGIFCVTREREKAEQ